MNGAEHYAEGERLLELAERIAGDGEVEDAAIAIAVAQAYATLAHVWATSRATFAEPPT